MSPAGVAETRVAVCVFYKSVFYCPCMPAGTMEQKCYVKPHAPELAEWYRAKHPHGLEPLGFGSFPFSFCNTDGVVCLDHEQVFFFGLLFLCYVKHLKCFSICKVGQLPPCAIVWNSRTNSSFQTGAHMILW